MTVVKIGKEDVELKEEMLQISEATLNDFLSQFASLYNFYQQKYADAQFIANKYKDRFGTLSSQKFKEYKETNGSSDKMAESCAKFDSEVVEAQDKMRIAEHSKDILWGFLRSMDMAHSNAKEMSYNLRKEMDKIGSSWIRTTEVG